jgi:hypothetical protein
MSSSFTKAYKAARKEHRERSQPQRRKRLGLLEKGKDWALRREDFHKKVVATPQEQMGARRRMRRDATRIKGRKEALNSASC